MGVAKMATMVKLSATTSGIIDEVYRRANDAEENRLAEYLAAVKLQSWFRANRVKAYLKHLNESAVQIQKRWRAYIGRQRFRKIIKEQVFLMKLNAYNSMATKIQKLWRGFYVRKYIFNYYCRKRYLEGLVVKNEIIRSELSDYAEQQAQQRQWQHEQDQRRRLNEFTSKYHYLVSTQVMPGVFNSPFKPYPEEMEFHLRNAKPHKTAKSEDTKLSEGDVESRKYDPGWKSYDLPMHEPLPPIHAKPQGPFRDPRDVQKQRYKPWQPSLRVATAYTSVEEAREKMKQEEWVTRINDNIFVPFTRRNVPYETLLHTTSKYGHLPYGTKYYRQEFPDKWTFSQNFQKVVPPIPIFEKLNDTYSQGQV